MQAVAMFVAMIDSQKNVAKSIALLSYTWSGYAIYVGLGLDGCMHSIVLWEVLDSLTV